MRNFPGTFERGKQSFVSAFLICMSVSLIKYHSSICEQLLGKTCYFHELYFLKFVKPYFFIIQETAGSSHVLNYERLQQ